MNSNASSSQTWGLGWTRADCLPGRRGFFCYPPVPIPSQVPTGGAPGPQPAEGRSTWELLRGCRLIGLNRLEEIMERIATILGCAFIAVWVAVLFKALESRRNKDDRR